jgi:hypothetical protein
MVCLHTSDHKGGGGMFWLSTRIGSRTGRWVAATLSACALAPAAAAATPGPPGKRADDMVLVNGVPRTIAQARRAGVQLLTPGRGSDSRLLGFTTARAYRAYQRHHAGAQPSRRWRAPRAAAAEIGASDEADFFYNQASSGFAHWHQWDCYLRMNPGDRTPDLRASWSAWTACWGALTPSIAGGTNDNIAAVWAGANGTIIYADANYQGLRIALNGNDYLNLPSYLLNRTTSICNRLERYDPLLGLVRVHCPNDWTVNR